MSSPKILIACECSQIECIAFRSVGCAAWSCDIQPCYGGHPEWHIQADVRNVDMTAWDLVIAHPPCTFLTAASACRMYYSPLRCLRPGNINEERFLNMIEARAFFYWFWENVPCPLCIENPRPLHCAALPPYSQVVCPSDFGHNVTKRTCYWLRNLPPLLPTHAHDGQRGSWLNHCSSRMNRRSRSFEGIAAAMAQQWGSLL